MSDNAPTPSADQIAAFQRLDKILGNADQPFGDENWAEVRKWLPDALTNPQPVLPTEPGHYVDAGGALVSLDTDGWHHAGTWIGEEMLTPPLTRLVPERPQVTRQQIASAIDEVVNKWADTGGGLVSPLTERIADLVQGARA